MNSDQITSLLEGKEIPALHLVPASGSALFSQIGGNPVVPEDFAWPRWNERSLAFLAQIDLAEITERGVLDGLPPTGRLYFFYDQDQSTWGFDPKDRGSWQVIFIPDAPSLRSASPPEDVSPDSIFDQRQITFRKISTYPSAEALGVDLYSLTEQAWDEFDSERYADFDKLPHHQIGGAPDVVQNDCMELECQLASNGINFGDPTGHSDPRIESLKSGADDWQLLLQIDSDEDLGMMWGDCGLIYFWIRKQDLLAGDFSNVWMILQCS